jgi:NAD(P)H-hydrate repair Nnr-like enzyme with NAD(P)H-hydrate dehydratase domain
VPVVVDARHDWLLRSTRGSCSCVITPHPASRRGGWEWVVEVQADRPGAVRELSRRHGGCQVVLKGYQTLVGSAEGRLDINNSGDAALAQGGQGMFWLDTWQASRPAGAARRCRRPSGTPSGNTAPQRTG